MKEAQRIKKMSKLIEAQASLIEDMQGFFASMPFSASDMISDYYKRLEEVESLMSEIESK